MHQHKIFGMYNMHVPEFIVTDPELLKNILIKDFEYFQNHPSFESSDDEIFSKNLFMLKGEMWRNLRIRLTTMFTTGKMKMMFPLVDKCGQTLNNVLSAAADKQESLEINEIISRFGIDAIASCVFGIETGCLTNQNIEILQMTRRIFSPRFQTMLLVLWPKMPRKLANLFKLTFVDNAVANYFKKIAVHTIKYREENNISRNDFIDLAIALKNNIIQKKYHDNSEKEDLDKLLAQMGAPLTGLHNDERYYEKPKEFYPEHFTEEAKTKRPNYTYLPFGDGPRICIGERFAKMKLKVGLIYMLKDFEFTISPKMKLPYEWTKEFGFKVKGGIWLQIKRI